MKTLAIRHLASGGLITNYSCPSQCRHCLYACSPMRSRDYMTPETARENARIIKKLGCQSVHMGGGEPFVNPSKLLEVLAACKDEGLFVEYVETNASWFQNQEKTSDILSKLRQAGCSRLLISISPFHNEHVPFSKVRGLLETCRSQSFDVMPWVADFYWDLEKAGGERPVSLEKMEQVLGPGFISNIPNRYWIHWAGRAPYSFARILDSLDAPAIAARFPGPCRELADTGHFHLDLGQNYIPGLCSGMAIHSQDLGKPLLSGKYPVIETLWTRGIGGLMDWAKKEHGFSPKGRFLSKCHLCTQIRTLLVVEKGFESPDLAPGEFYFQLQREGKSQASSPELKPGSPCSPASRR